MELTSVFPTDEEAKGVLIGQAVCASEGAAIGEYRIPIFTSFGGAVSSGTDMRPRLREQRLTKSSSQSPLDSRELPHRTQLYSPPSALPASRTEAPSEVPWLASLSFPPSLLHVLTFCIGAATATGAPAAGGAAATGTAAAGGAGGAAGAGAASARAASGASGTAGMTVLSGSAGAVAGATAAVGGAASAATSGVVAGATAAAGGREYHLTSLSLLIALTSPAPQSPPSDLPPPLLLDLAPPPRQVELRELLPPP